MKHQQVQAEVRSARSQAVGGRSAAGAGRGLGGVAAAGRAPGLAGRIADPSLSDRGGSDAARRAGSPFGRHVELRALGPAAGLCRVCWTESHSRASSIWVPAAAPDASAGEKEGGLRSGWSITSGFIGSIGKSRDEGLNQNWFVSLEEAGRIIESSRVDHNTVRPHSNLGY